VPGAHPDARRQTAHRIALVEGHADVRVEVVQLALGGLGLLQIEIAAVGFLLDPITGLLIDIQEGHLRGGRGHVLHADTEVRVVCVGLQVGLVDRTEL